MTNTFDPLAGLAPSEAERIAEMLARGPDPELSRRLPARPHPHAPVQPPGQVPVGLGKAGGIYHQPGPAQYGPREEQHNE